MKFTSEIWHTHSAGLPESFKPILVLSPDCICLGEQTPILLCYDEEEENFFARHDVSYKISIEEFQRYLGCWAYLDDLLGAEQKLATAIEYLQKIAWLNTTDDYFCADYHVHLDWCKHVANEALKQIKEEK